MLRMNAKRGYVPDDEQNFSPEALTKMRNASRQVFFLLNEGYDLKSASTFVGNHFLLSERQRLAIMRSLATEKQLQQRKDKQKTPELLRGARCAGITSGASAPDDLVNGICNAVKRIAESETTKTI